MLRVLLWLLLLAAAGTACAAVPSRVSPSMISVPEVRESQANAYGNDPLTNRDLRALKSVSVDISTDQSCGGCWCAPGNGTCPSWHPTTFNTSFITAFSAQRALNPFSLANDCDPYQNASCTVLPAQSLVNSTTAVCARMYADDGVGQCSTYKLSTFESVEAAHAAGAVITHERACGLCSTTQDVGVYLAYPDLTRQGKICGIEAVLSRDLGIECFMKLGFTRSCAVIWTYDAIFDTKHCGTICVEELFAPDNGPPPFCPINKCLECDEEQAGPIFKSFAGATRRRSGILSTIIRPCTSVAHLEQQLC